MLSVSFLVFVTILVLKWECYDFLSDDRIVFQDDDDSGGENPGAVNTNNIFYQADNRVVPKISRPGQELVFQWNQIRFNFGSEASTIPTSAEEFRPGNENSFFIPYNNIPVGLDRWKDKVFITIPRRAFGIPATVAYVSLSRDATQTSPGLRPYPSLRANTFSGRNKASLNPPLVSVYRPAVDSCDRLWLVDTGLVQSNPSKTVHKPAVVVYDLNTDKQIRRFEIPDSVMNSNDPAGLVRVTIDTEDGDCSNAHAYIADIFTPRILVYSLKQNKAWEMIHAAFYINPMLADVTLNGLSYEWRDGVFSIALSTKYYNGRPFTYAVFHSMANYFEYAVPTDVLKNETLAIRPFHFNDVENIGEKGDLSQTACHDIHKGTGVVFMTQVAKNAVACWNTAERLSPDKVEILTQDDDLIFYPADIQVDQEDTVWILTNKFPAYFFSTLDPNRPNFRIFRMNVQQAIDGTRCASRQW